MVCCTQHAHGVFTLLHAEFHAMRSQGFPLLAGGTRCGCFDGTGLSVVYTLFRAVNSTGQLHALSGDILFNPLVFLGTT